MIEANCQLQDFAIPEVVWRGLELWFPYSTILIFAHEKTASPEKQYEKAWDTSKFGWVPILKSSLIVKNSCK